MSTQEAAKQAGANLELITKGLELLAKKLFANVEACVEACMNKDAENAESAITLRPEFALILSKLAEAVDNFIALDEYIQQNLDASTASPEAIEKALEQERNLVTIFMQAVGEVKQYIQGLM